MISDAASIEIMRRKIVAKDKKFTVDYYSTMWQKRLETAHSQLTGPTKPAVAPPGGRNAPTIPDHSRPAPFCRKLAAHSRSRVFCSRAGRQDRGWAGGGHAGQGRGGVGWGRGVITEPDAASLLNECWVLIKACGGDSRFVVHSPGIAARIWAEIGNLWISRFREGASMESK